MEFVIPEELLVNILVRLPLKDIFRLKLVCKSWLRLISSSSDPYFRINYARNSPFTLIFQVQTNFYNPNNKLSISLLEFARKGNTHHHHHHHHIPITPPEIPDCSNLSCIGSCHGFAFFLHRKHLADDQVVLRVYSFNPVSGSCVLVSEDIIGIWGLRIYMAGFIPSNNTYKLLRFLPGFGKGVDKAEIFTVGLDENWRKVDDPLLFYGAFNAHAHGRVICFDGAYHWLPSSCDQNDGDDDGIFTFHLLEEKSGTRIPKPHGMSQRISDNNTRLTMFEDRLSVVERSEDEDYSSSTMVVWTMREYGVVESWSKVFVLPLKHTYREKLRYCDLVPIVVLANGDILFSDKSSKDDSPRLMIIPRIHHTVSTIIRTFRDFIHDDLTHNSWIYRFCSAETFMFPSKFLYSLIIRRG